MPFRRARYWHAINLRCGNWSAVWCSTWTRHVGFAHRREKPEWRTIATQQSIRWPPLTQAEQVLSNYQINDEEVLMCVIRLDHHFHADWKIPTAETLHEHSLSQRMNPFVSILFGHLLLFASLFTWSSKHVLHRDFDETSKRSEGQCMLCSPLWSHGVIWICCIDKSPIVNTANEWRQSSTYGNTTLSH